MKITPEIEERLKKLEEKYSAMGQDMTSYLDGLLYSTYLTYWDYIRLDTLLSLQVPETPFEDEAIFIMYHQITELYFKLTRHAIEIITNDPKLTIEKYLVQIKRINGYFGQLIGSFGIMIDGMDKDQFLKFRMSLLPASGFQSAQYRMIEICSTNIDNLIHHKSRQALKSSTDIIEKYKYLYWKRGATELATGKKTLTLKQFEQKYGDELIHMIKDFFHKNLYERYKQLPEKDQENDELIEQLRLYDFQANIGWPLQHFKSAARYLERDEKDIAATGGTNWQKYLPPKFQHIQFFPQLWTKQEKEDWGTRAILEHFKV